MLMKTCSSCGGETYSAANIDKCIECGEIIDNMKAQPASNDNGNAETSFSYGIDKIKEG